MTNSCWGNNANSTCKQAKPEEKGESFVKMVTYCKSTREPGQKVANCNENNRVYETLKPSLSTDNVNCFQPSEVMVSTDVNTGINHQSVDEYMIDNCISKIPLWDCKLAKQIRLNKAIDVPEF